jgi:hypothetical protein
MSQPQGSSRLVIPTSPALFTHSQGRGGWGWIASGWGRARAPRRSRRRRSHYSHSRMCSGGCGGEDDRGAPAVVLGQEIVEATASHDASHVIGSAVVQETGGGHGVLQWQS